MNTMHFQDIVKGKYGRKIAYTDVSEIDESNIVKVVGESIGVFNFNRRATQYLWDYLYGDQPALYREKTIRDDINNKVVENHAYEIVQFKNAQTYGEPVQCVSLKQDERINLGVDRLNDYCRGANKHVKDISCGEWQSATGTGFKAIQRTGKNSLIPFRITVPTPLNTFVIYQRSTEEPILAVQQLKDETGRQYLLCFSETHEYRIMNGQLLSLDAEQPVFSRLHAFGGIPIVEYPNNQQRLSDIEIVITMLDAINEIQSNRADSIAQFVQSWVKFVNCEIDSETFEKMKTAGALVVKSNNGESNKADVDILTQELNQTQSQVSKDDLYNNVLQIEGIPNREGNTGGDTAGAVGLRNGWDESRQRANIKDSFVKASEKQLMKLILTILRQTKGVAECPINELDFDVKIVHSPTDNLFVKAESLELLLRSGIHPLVAITTCGLWSDAEKAYIESKPYLQAIYKTADEKAQEILSQREYEAQMNKAKQILSNGEREV